MRRISSNSMFAAASAIAPLSELSKSLPHSTLFPFYHAVSNEKLTYIESYYKVRTFREFENDLDQLLKHFEPVDFGNGIKLKDVRKPSFHLSFDDGLSSCYHTIAPILLKKGIPATFFVSPDFIDNKNLFHRFKNSILANKIEHLKSEVPLNVIAKKLQVHPNKQSIIDRLLKMNYNEGSISNEIAQLINVEFSDFLKHEKPYLNTSELKWLKEKGFNIGSHSIDHPEFDKLNKEQQLDQISKSIDTLQLLINDQISCFAFPFTDWGIVDDLFLKIKGLFGNDFYTFGTAGLKADKIENHFQRIPIEEYPKWHAFKVVRSEMMAFQLKRKLGKHQSQRGL